MSKLKPTYTRVAQLKSFEDFNNHQKQIGTDIGLDVELNSAVFAKSIALKSGKKIGNSLCILPMEGWDAQKNGKPSEFTKKRWEKFAVSGAKLLFGCEAVAIDHSAKANPNQLVMNEENFDDFVALRQLILDKHLEKFGDTSDLVIGLQLTHSGRFCKPDSHAKFEPKVAYRHPQLDQKFHVEDQHLLTDDDIDQIIVWYVNAAVLAQKAGFDFIDVKHCHGYLGHELLSARTRAGKYGGSFENRTRYMRNIIAGIQAAAPGLEMGIRLSAMDFMPFKKGENEIGTPDQVSLPYSYSFGGSEDGLDMDLGETKAFLALAESLGIQLVCITAGSPYYNPHLTRPALFPPSDGYLPPEDPLVGVQRHLDLTAAIKADFPELVIIGSGYSYLQDWLPQVAHFQLRNGRTDMVGFGRMVLSYPTMPSDMLNSEASKRNLICRTFSDCTTAPRNGIISGCYPLDPIYKNLPQAQAVKDLK